ncbi:MAG: hypothetical protein V9F03_07075 [Microthrixaceae bacterium]
MRRELFGPADGEAPAGNPIDCSGNEIYFESPEASRGQFHDAATLQEILTQSDPLRRYGVGVLYSGAARGGTPIAPGDHDDDNEDIDWVPGLASAEENPEGPTVEVKGKLRDDVADSDDFDLTDANTTSNLQLHADLVQVSVSRNDR